MLDFAMNESSLKIIKNKEEQYNLPYLWIRDNCSCDQCRVKETQEKRFMLNAVSVDLKPKKVVIDKDIVSIEWPDNHKTSINISELENLNKSRKPEKILWTNDFIPEYYDWNEFIDNKNVAIDAFTNFITKGAICIKNAPSTPNSLENLCA